MRDLTLGVLLYVVIAAVSVVPFLIFGTERWVAVVWLAWLVVIFGVVFRPRSGKT